MTLTARHNRFVNLCFRAHQPRLLRMFTYADVAVNNNYFDDDLTAEVTRRISARSYSRMNRMLLKLFRRYPQLSVTFSLSGTLLEQMNRYCPETLESFGALVRSGNVEFLAEPYYHSLASVGNTDLFIRELHRHDHFLRTLFNITPAVVRNTELIYRDRLGEITGSAGFSGTCIHADAGAASRFGEQVFRHPGHSGILLFPQSQRLGDEIAFRFDRSGRSPIRMNEFLAEVEGKRGDASFISYDLDYNLFGTFLKEESGIFEFMEDLLSALMKRGKATFVSLAEAASVWRNPKPLSLPDWTSRAGGKQALSDWLGNDMQQDVFCTVYQLERMAGYLGSEAIDELSYLQASDYLFMVSAAVNGKTIPPHPNACGFPCESPHRMYTNLMNILSDIDYRIGLKRSVKENRGKRGKFLTEIHRSF